MDFSPNPRLSRMALPVQKLAAASNRSVTGNAPTPDNMFVTSIDDFLSGNTANREPSVP